MEHGSETIDVRGVALHVDRGGEGEPVLFLHAAGGAGAWTGFHATLAGGCELIAPHHPGFGVSPDVEWVEVMDDLVLFYVDLIEQQGWTGCSLVGCSLGGWLAVELAVHHPEWFRRLVLIDPAGLEIPEAPIRDWFGMNREEITAALFADPEVAADMFPDAEADPDVELIVARHREARSTARLAWDSHGANPRLPAWLHRARMPTLLVWGEKDGLIPVLHGERYRELLPDARLEVIENAGHAPHNEAPEETGRLVLNFLKEA